MFTQRVFTQTRWGTSYAHGRVRRRDDALSMGHVRLLRWVVGIVSRIPCTIHQHANTCQIYQPDTVTPCNYLHAWGSLQESATRTELSLNICHIRRTSYNHPSVRDSMKSLCIGSIYEKKALMKYDSCVRFSATVYVCMCVYVYVYVYRQSQNYSGEIKCFFDSLNK
jgi:hypothetical protein